MNILKIFNPFIYRWTFGQVLAIMKIFSIYINLDYFQVLVIVSNAAMNISVLVFLWMSPLIFIRQMGVEQLSQSGCVLYFLETNKQKKAICQSILQSQYLGIPVAPEPRMSHGDNSCFNKSFW